MVVVYQWALLAAALTSCIAWHLLALFIKQAPFLAIQSQSRLAALDDEELSDSFTTILRVTGDVNRSLELNALAADIARGKQIDLVVGDAFEIADKLINETDPSNRVDSFIFDIWQSYGSARGDHRWDALRETALAKKKRAWAWGASGAPNRENA